MKKFEDKFNENISLIKTALGDVCSVTHVKAVFKDWISPEDHQAEIGEFKRENQRLRNLLEAAGESSKELLDINKKLRGDLGDAQGKLRGSEDHIKELKSQLEKQQPEIPEVPHLVADWLDKKPLYAINGSIPVEVIEWSQKQTGYADLGMNISHLLKLKVNGYTVVKEKRFYLKAKELLVVGDYDHVEDLWLDFNKNYTPKKSMAHKFTQKEIDSMETGSYEQIEVEE